MTRQIKLFRHGDCWMSRDNDPVVRELFGTDVLPTAFRSCMAADAVVREIQRLNPDADVRAEEKGDA